jgi:hypothetical protein
MPRWWNGIHSGLKLCCKFQQNLSALLETVRVEFVKFGERLTGKTAANTEPSLTRNC